MVFTRLFFLLNLFYFTGAYAAIKYVPANYSTITGAINACSSMDTILVSPGTYYENIIIDTSKIGLRIIGLAGASTTIIDGSGISSVITINGKDSIDDQIILKGFTIQNGFSQGKGGGCLFDKSNVLLSEMTIKNNYLEGINNYCQGAGLFASKSIVTIENSSIKGNIIKNSYEAHGAGIGSNEASILLKNCYVAYNTSISHHKIWGGGIHTSKGYLKINSCIIKNNSAINFLTTTSTAFWAYGGGLMLIDMNADIVNSLITENYVDSTVALYSGAAIYVLNGSPIIQKKIKISHCTIANNFGGFQQGDAVFNNNAASGLIDSMIFTNCILWNYTAFEILMSVDTMQIFNCDLKDTLDLGLNCIYADPQFLTLSDFHLKPSSPCANRGFQIVNVDLDGSIRPMPLGHLPDLGCYEVDESITGINIPGDPTNVFITTNGSQLIIKNAGGICNIYNLSGQKVYSIKLSENPEQYVDLSNLRSDFYLVNVIKEDSKSNCKKILRIN